MKSSRAAVAAAVARAHFFFGTRATRSVPPPPVVNRRGSSSSTRRAGDALEATSTAKPSMKILQLPTQYLRAMDRSNFDPVTLQRTDCFFDVHNGKPRSHPLSLQTCRNIPTVQNCVLLDQGTYEITWTDGLISQYSHEWVEQTLLQWNESDSNRYHDYSDQVLWTSLTEEKVRTSSSLSIQFDQAITEDGMNMTLRALYEYGIVLVTGTPIHDSAAAVAALAASLSGGSLHKHTNGTSLLSCYQQRYSSKSSKSSHDDDDQDSATIVLPRGTDGPLRTLYGTVWSTTTTGQDQGTSVADSAYGQDGLPLHTDMTYHRDPPGLQIFTMLQPALHGGTSLFADGLAAAEALRRTCPDAFQILSQTVRRYRSVDPVTGWHLEASGPMIQLDRYDNSNSSTYNGKVVQIRHNDLDRLPDLPPPDQAANADAFYQRLEAAHAEWDAILAREDVRLEMQLQPGDTMVVANQVCGLIVVCSCLSLVLIALAVRISFHLIRHSWDVVVRLAMKAMSARQVQL